MTPNSCSSLLALPKFEEQPEDMVVFEGERARFPCTIHGSPPPTIRWFRNSHPLEMDSRMTSLPSGKFHLNVSLQLFNTVLMCNLPSLYGYDIDNKRHHASFVFKT